MFISSICGHITLKSAGLIALADLSTVAVRTALTGTSSYLDALVLAPGMHQQQSAVNVNDGELPLAGSIITEYVFRVENPATVNYLRHISRTGKLVTAWVSSKPSRHCNSFTNPFSDVETPLHNYPLFVAGVRAALLYLLCPLLIIIVLILLGTIRDCWALGVLTMVMLSRLINVAVIKRRRKKEQGAYGDLLVSFAIGFATLLVYVSAALAGNASTVGNLHILCLLLCSAALLSLCNSSTQCLQMFNRIVRKCGEEEYEHRLEMVKDLVRTSRKGDWAVHMDLIKRDEWWYFG
ncbi:hypothetical protein ARMSODRAFT_991032 [Armillaria solidipes]|uniref:Uncharacterized protein n=1 Tax=Armillaria solidipes TaxID=1076256 RepID=A0A2H3B5J7_9AGAR|nr:hypothetical protein ARMSODRAFT_991032 [Armillaria solidipes]